MSTTHSATVYRCRWPGNCPADAALMIGAGVSLRPFHCCARHAEIWRMLTWPEMIAVHGDLHPPRPRSVVNYHALGAYTSRV